VTGVQTADSFSGGRQEVTGGEAEILSFA